MIVNRDDKGKPPDDREFSKRSRARASERRHHDSE
jgi:hypothetical protein